MRQKWTSNNFTQLPICYMTWISKTYQQEWEIWQPHISLFHLHLFSFYPLRHRIPSCLHTEASQGAENKDLTLFWTLRISNKWIMSGASSLLWSLFTVLQKDSLINKLIHVLVNISFRILWAVKYYMENTFAASTLSSALFETRFVWTRVWKRKAEIYRD